MIDFSKLRFLVVDDFSEFRSSIRGILGLLAVQKIDTAANGEEVMEKCRRNRYDVILHDYNLGDGINGQQVLEQLHAEKLLSPYCIFIMVTAENTQAMVLAAIECEPDDYLSKPFSKVALQTRLERQVRRKQVLAPVLAGIDGADLEGVIHACNAIEASEPRHAVLCMKYKAVALHDLGRFLQLEALLEAQARSRPATWNIQRLAKLWLEQGREDKLAALLAGASRQFPLMPELHDIRADQAERNNDLAAVQSSLQHAVSLSPNNLARQIRLAAAAWLNERPDVALHALRQCWEIGRYSMYFTPEILWQMLFMLTRSATPADEAQQWRRLLDKSDMQTAALRPALELLDMELRQRKDLLPDATRLAEAGKAILEHWQDYSAVTLLQLATLLQGLGRTEDASRCLRLCAKRHAGQAGVLARAVQAGAQVDAEAQRQALQALYQSQQFHRLEQEAEAVAQQELARQHAPELLELALQTARLQAGRVRSHQTGANQALREQLDTIGTVSRLDAAFYELESFRRLLEAQPW